MISVRLSVRHADYYTDSHGVTSWLEVKRREATHIHLSEIVASRSAVVLPDPSPIVI